MFTRRTALAVAIILLAAVGVANADIGRNFEKAGIAVMGSASYYTNLGYVLDSASEYSYWDATVSPEIDFFFLESTALYVAPEFYYASSTSNSTNTSRSERFSINAGILRYFVGSPSAQTGLVPAIGAQVGIDAYPGVGDLVAGVEQTDSSMYLYLNVAASARLYYFINDVVAPYVMLVPSIRYLMSASDSTGSPYTITADSALTMRISVYVGFSYWIPRKQMSLTK
jgi:hypothetical protein